MITTLRTILISALAMPTLALANPPDQPVTAICGYAAGGTCDLVLRQMAKQLAPRFPKGVVVSNMPGVGGALSLQHLTKAKPDGLTFALTTNSQTSLAPQVSSVSYKGPDDFLPVIGVVSFPPVLIVKEESPYKDLAAFVKLAKEKDGKLSIGFPGLTSNSHFSAILLQKESNTKLVEVPFAGWGQAVTQLLGGHVDAVVGQPGEALPLVNDKKARVIAVFSGERLSSMPTVPTAKELGYPVQFDGKYLVAVPNGTPVPVVKYLHDTVKEVIESGEFKEFTERMAISRFAIAGEDLRKILWREYDGYTDLLKKANIKR